MGERLISMLDPLSTLHLIESKMIDKEILQKIISVAVWSNFIRGTSNGEQELLEEEDVRILVKILRCMQLKEPGPLLLPLLDRICESGVICATHIGCGSDDTQIICPCHKEPHCISTCEILLLEEVESAFGTTEQILESISCSWPDMDVLLAISSRISRQKETVTYINVRNGKFCIEDKSSVQAFITLLKAETVYIAILEVGEAMGEEEWQTLATALQGETNVLGSVDISRQALAEARDSIKDIWDATREDFSVHSKNGTYSYSLPVHKSNYDWENAWMKLKRISTMTEDEFAVRCRAEYRLRLAAGERY